ncbi:hypothetical protein Taro_004136, partial [Colocasia esculenta]|nr:hypothetical protein [Colocasia esculenta]
EINAEFSGSPLRLQLFVVVTGIVYLLFAYFVPTISAMRNWLVASAVLTSGHLRKENKAKEFKIPGSQADKVFNAFGAIAATLVSNTSGLLPEIQVS